MNERSSCHKNHDLSTDVKYLVGFRGKRKDNEERNDDANDYDDDHFHTNLPSSGGSKVYPIRDYMSNAGRWSADIRVHILTA